MRTKSFADIWHQWGRIQEYAGKRYDSNKFFKLLDTWVLYKDNICKHFYGVSHGYMFGRINDMQSFANKKVSRKIYAGY